MLNIPGNENGLAERSFQTLFSLSRSLQKHADLPDRIWGKAVLHSAYIMNQSPSSALGGIAPLQFRLKEPIDLSHLRVFGSPAQIFVRSTIRNDNKLSDLLAEYSSAYPTKAMAIFS
jgi:hypothetical protein